jgi:hypothetical protein
VRGVVPEIDIEGSAFFQPREVLIIAYPCSLLARMESTSSRYTTQGASFRAKVNTGRDRPHQDNVCSYSNSQPAPPTHLLGRSSRTLPAICSRWWRCPRSRRSLHLQLPPLSPTSSSRSLKQHRSDTIHDLLLYSWPISKIRSLLSEYLVGRKGEHLSLLPLPRLR